MQHKTLTLGLSALLLALAGQTMAQNAPKVEAPAIQKHPERSQQHKHHGKHRTERQAQHPAQLLEKLQLRPDQQTAWNNFSQAMQKPERQAQRSEQTPLKTPERIAQIQAQRAEHHQAMDQRLQAMQTFYDQLNSEQKIIFDQQSHPHRQGKHRQHMRFGPAEQAS